MTYQYKKGLHFSEFVITEASRQTQVENVNPGWWGHLAIGGTVIAWKRTINGLKYSQSKAKENKGASRKRTVSASRN